MLSSSVASLNHRALANCRLPKWRFRDARRRDEIGVKLATRQCIHAWRERMGGRPGSGDEDHGISRHAPPLYPSRETRRTHSAKRVEIVDEMDASAGPRAWRRITRREVIHREPGASLASRLAKPANVAAVWHQ